jgi:deferrochelatase/peroxidase EfeB
LVESLLKPMINPSPIDYSDIQGLVRFGYQHLSEAGFFLLRVKDRSAARSWLAAAPVSNAVEMPTSPTNAMQVAVACDGLRALQVPEKTLDGFSDEFILGMADEGSRSRRLGDIGSSAPSNWRWGSSGRVPHVLVMLYSTPGGLHAWTEAVQGPHWNTAFEIIEFLSTCDMGGVEPFGFKDGVSQPALDWHRKRQGGRDEMDYGNLAALGEFLLGYLNEYGRYTDRPLIDSIDDPQGHLLQAEEQSDKRDLGRNGSYLVLRDLQQDVQGFWQFLDHQARSNALERTRLAEAMVGRAMDGQPLMPTRSRPIAGVGPKADDVESNQFTYESDAAGTRCPLGAHIRRANPRNGDFPYGTEGLLGWLIRVFGFGQKTPRDDLIASTRFHRILRRGREYGTKLSPEQALIPGGPDGPGSGLRFICLNANISRQFEFVQSAWIMSTKFDGLTEESDPLLGNRQPLAGCPSSDVFSIPESGGVRRRLKGMPQFVTVRGGAYFFLPSIRALRYIASLSD